MRLPRSLWPAVFRSVSTDRWPPRSNDAARTFLRACADHHLIGLLADDPDVPEVVADARKQFGALHHAEVARTRLHADALKQVAHILDGEQLVLLKGCDYAYRLYDKPHLRPMADIDFLVRSDRFVAVGQRLRQAGLQQSFIAGTSSRVPWHHEMTFHLGRITVEPHQFFAQRSRNRIDYAAIWNRAVPFDGAGIQAFRLADDDALLYTAVSLALKVFEPRFLRYLDFFLLAARTESDCAPVIQRAREWRLERALFAAIQQTASVLPELSPRLIDAAESLLDHRTRRHIRSNIINSEMHQPTRWEQLWKKFELMDRRRERVRFLAGHAWANVAGAWYGLRDRLGPRVPVNGGGVSESNRPFDASATKQRF